MNIKTKIMFHFYFFVLVTFNVFYLITSLYRKIIFATS